VPASAEHKTYTREIAGHHIYCQEFIRSDARALLLYCHGYADHCSWHVRDHIVHFVEQGYSVCALDYPGHGYSSGIHGLISDFSTLPEVAANIFTDCKQRYPDKPAFLVGESMGACVAALAQQKMGSSISGIVMIAPMSGMSQQKQPPWMAVKALELISIFAPTAAVVPTANLNDRAVKMAEVRQDGLLNSLYYRKPLRVMTAVQLLRANRLMAEEVYKNLSCPILICHGDTDVVTDPTMSRRFFDMLPEQADKTYKLYAGMWHSLLSGEPPESREQVYADITSWLAAHCPG